MYYNDKGYEEKFNSVNGWEHCNWEGGILVTMKGC